MLEECVKHFTRSVLFQNPLHKKIEYSEILKGKKIPSILLHFLANQTCISEAVQNRELKQNAHT